ncbi:S-adenosyl-L-methionine-dependent methyltransferase [Hyaloraphidium curvatum]|nr:S-adenosyl-L-methionine-dependent methyltransferase [Hyaloraphidium curvatum]
MTDTTPRTASRFGSLAHYVITGGASGRARLQLLHRVFGASTARLLDAAGLPAGARVWDVGCGGGDVAVDLAARVGPAGFVVATDLDEEQLGIAVSEARAAGISNLEYRLLDAVEPYPFRDDEPKFDAVYIRFLLSHLPERRATLHEAFAALSDDGVLIVEDTDFGGQFSFPESEALASLVRWELATRTKRGGNGNLGRELPSLIRAAGFRDIQVDVINPADTKPGSDVKLLTAVTLQLIKPAIVEDGLATEAEVDGAVQSLRNEIMDPNQLLSMPRVVRVIARKP